MGNRGLMPVDFTLLRDFLKLPEGTRIVDVRVTNNDFGRMPMAATLLLESDDFPSTPTGCKLPYVTAEFTADDDGQPAFVQWKIDDAT